MITYDKTSSVSTEQQRVKKWGTWEKINEEDFVKFSKVFSECFINPYPKSGPRKGKELVIGMKSDYDEFYAYYSVRKYTDGKWRVRRYSSTGYGNYYRTTFARIAEFENINMPTETLMLQQRKEAKRKIADTTGKEKETVPLVVNKEIEGSRLKEHYVLSFDTPEEIKEFLIEQRNALEKEKEESRNYYTKRYITKYHES